MDRGRVCAVVNQIAAYDVVTMCTQDIGDCATAAGGLPDRARRQRQNTQKCLNGHRWRFVQIVSTLGMRVTLYLATMVKHEGVLMLS